MLKFHEQVAGEAQYYEKILIGRRRQGGFYNAEAEWDRRAEQYDASQKCKNSQITGMVTAFLKNKGLLSGSVLDVGGGTGHYAIPFAHFAKEVVITDISTKMMERAEKNAESKGLNSIQCKKLDWENADLDALGWKKKFDFVFSSMSPAIRNLSGLSNMVEASRGWCCINQFIVRKDTISQKLSDILENNRPQDPHNDRNLALAFFHLLWMCGFEPEISYFRDEESLSLTIDQAFIRYAGRYGVRMQERNLDLREILAGLTKDGKITAHNQSTLAVICWNVSRWEE
ncbi:MAG: class I SAM-dependent methyltransferase [Oscillospiraceae bacterium]|nr:class I SAM-dependent methyltransferase [Oscillospiraceae bacterium]